MSDGLSNKEITRVVYGYIGVSAGYLADFSYSTLREFYPVHCDLDINSDEIEGTSRSRFIHILERAQPLDQAKILDGVLSRFPPGGRRSEAMADEIRGIAARLRGRSGAAHARVVTGITSATLDQCWRDLDALLSSSGAASAVDRIHTALHAYLHAACTEFGIAAGTDPTVQDLMKAIIKGHPRFKIDGPRAEDIEGIVRALATMLHHLNPLRNKASLAHANPLLPENEATLVVGLVKVLIAYLDAKLRLPKAQQSKAPF